ncbi:ketoacyl-ACP synthase III family protein [Nocardia alba]|uniref:3-oxoacyl-[acyl-carrier-protein] synthase-3 n=1 Tax=Nocardia alba TaxID=225051 RepID=A0A4R1FAT1_9NOCA|nr:ketoacyl-ACP synthase III family protein [Nocardia alba]TCJ89884.1 3-oxoacyl-[acyl-carrier-protein] synthase-3 [Nocardia alba]
MYITATATDLPAPTPVHEEIALGRIDSRSARRLGIRSVCRSEQSGAESALRAGRTAISEAAISGDQVKLVLHASAYFQGYDMWSSAAYVQHGAVGNTCLTLDVAQLSNGGLASLELAGQFLSGRQDSASVLITTGDRFCEPGIDRWRTDPGTVFADGGTALLVSNSGGFAELLSVTGRGAPELEQMSRGADPAADAPLRSTPITIDHGREMLTRRYGLAELLKILQQGQLGVYDAALTGAGLAHEDIDWHVVPHLGVPKMRHQFFEPLGIEPDITNYEWGRTIGHLGAGDQIAGLHWLRQHRSIRPGSICALHGSGGGFYWSCAVIRFL